MWIPTISPGRCRASLGNLVLVNNSMCTVLDGTIPTEHSNKSQFGYPIFKLTTIVVVHLRYCWVEMKVATSVWRDTQSRRGKSVCCYNECFTIAFITCSKDLSSCLKDIFLLFRSSSRVPESGSECHVSERLDVLPIIDDVNHGWPGRLLVTPIDHWSCCLQNLTWVSLCCLRWSVVSKFTWHC